MDTLQGPMTGSTEFDNILQSISGTLAGYFDSKKPTVIVQAPAPPVATAGLGTSSDLITLAIIGLVVYLLIK